MPSVFASASPSHQHMRTLTLPPSPQVAAAMISIIDNMSMENTGTFQVVRTGGYEKASEDISIGTMEW